jgi:subtilisin family serine protease
MPASDDWNLRLVRSREARALLPQTAAGSGVVAWGSLRVGHLDTGYTPHPIFGDWPAGTAWLRPADGLNLREPGRPPLDPLDYEGNPGHGTRTCSVLCGDAGAGAPSEIGVAPRLPVVPCRIVSRVVLTPERNREAVAEGIKHLMGKGCQVISISLGWPSFLPGTTGGMGRAVDRAYEAGVIVVAAAGQVIDSVCYPAKYDRTIGVGGVTWQRRIWQSYNAGKDQVDVWAPAEGVAIAEALAAPGSHVVPPVEGEDPGSFSASTSSHGGGFGKSSGTSYATVHVAAAAAMWLLRHGAALDAAHPEPWQRVEAFRKLLRSSKTPINGVPPANGSGVLNIPGLLLEPLPDKAGLVKAPEDKDKWA